MAEVAVRNGSGQAAKLGTLAERINEEHRACGLAVNAALDHALEAGRLLVEAKAGCKHGTWRSWLEENFAGSTRTARSYMYLYRNRERIMAKRQSDAILSVADAARALRVLDPPPEPKFWQREYAVDAYSDPEMLAEQEAAAEQQRRYDAMMARERGLDKAEEQAKKGDPTKPRTVKLSDEEWAEAYAGAVEWRTREAAKVMFELLEYLQQATNPEAKGFRSEEAGVALLRIKPQDQVLSVLRDSIAWLQRVLEEAEREQGRMQEAE